MSDVHELFRTERLLVRWITSADVDAMCVVYGDDEGMRWVGDGGALDREGCIEWVAVTERNYATRGYGMSALVLQDTGAVVGFCGVVHPGGQPEAEIKYALARDHWGQGLATEAVRGMLAYAAERLGLERVIATVAPGNTASQRVLAKVGMTAGPIVVNDDGSRTMTFTWSAPSNPERSRR